MYDYVRDGNCPFSPTPMSAKWETSAAGIKLLIHKGHGQLLPVPLLIWEAGHTPPPNFSGRTSRAEVWRTY